MELGEGSNPLLNASVGQSRHLDDGSTPVDTGPCAGRTRATAPMDVPVGARVGAESRVDSATDRLPAFTAGAVPIRCARV